MGRRCRPAFRWRGTAQRIPYLALNPVHSEQMPETDFTPANDKPSIGPNPVNRTPIGSEHGIVMGAVGFGYGPGAVGVHGVFTSHRDSLVDRAVHACRVLRIFVSVSVVGDLSNRGEAADAHDRTRSIHR